MAHPSFVLYIPWGKPIGIGFGFPLGSKIGLLIDEFLVRNDKKQTMGRGCRVAGGYIILHFGITFAFVPPVHTRKSTAKTM
jgi:hypothetical protein